MRVTSARRLGAIAGAIAALVGAQIALPASAQAANGCSGTKIATYNMKGPYDTRPGVIELYWDGYRNCAASVHLGIWSGVRSSTYVLIYVCRSNRDGAACDPIDDRTGHDGGYYSYYANANSGPSAGHCIYVSGFMDISDGRAKGNSGTSSGRPVGHHCG